MKTPYLDSLSQKGLTFDAACICQPVCGSAGSAIFTGLYPHSNGAWTNCVPLYDNVKTIGQRLRDHNIQTAYIGKWHLDGGDYFGNGICLDGWDSDYWYDMRCYLEELTPKERVKSRDGSISKKDEVDEIFSFAHRCSNRAISYLNQHTEDDFLLVVSYNEPHDPCLCPESYASMYDDFIEPKKENVWDILEDKPSYQKVWVGDNVKADCESLDITPRRLYACNSYVNYEIGRVLEHIKKLAPDAMIIYTSDHGDMEASHCLYAKGPAPYDEITKIRINDAIFIEFGRYEIDHDGFG